MVGSGRFAVVAVLAVALAGCSTSGVSPKAFDRAPSLEPNEPPAARNIGENSDTEPVVVAPEVIEGWEFLYRFITETEFVLCLEGSRQDGRVVIDKFTLARMETTSVNSVRYQPCTSPRYVGTAHNHPPVDDPNKSLCYQSEPDRRSFGMDQRAVLDIVLCGDDKFLWVMKDGRSAARTVAVATK